MNDVTWGGIVPSVVLIIAGGALWWWSIALTVRAYRGERVPVWRNPPKAPGRAIAARAFGAATLTLGVGLAPWGRLDGPSWLVPFLAGSVAVVFLLVPYFVALAVHNRRVESA
ncbi:MULTISPECIES: hypothetical protein [Microbacterium]|jgi:hypothetical protein|uniref:hypothetical protein n=1 Tax=Microbacterium TaxID=33882 RepID=UPI0023DA10E5|nr:MULTISPECIES: hypothetical protein [Microbacterium]MDF2046557.1 hypothetical protein [Microbacterium sp. Kw_RZR3]MDQ1074949.1 hypothetical protein [Microbacterium sp. SORGH_AS_0969]MDQ1115175.1 hypothetical protein [Microbacterium testaceum]